MSFLGIESTRWIVILATTACIGVANAAASEATACFERYAVDLKRAIVDRDAVSLRRLVANPGLLGETNLTLAFGTPSADAGEFSFRRMLTSTDISILVDGRMDGESHGAMIYFVRTSALADAGIPGGYQVKGMSRDDYVACDVEVVDGQIRMADHFCFAETDLAGDE